MREKLGWKMMHFWCFRDQYVHLPQVRASKGNASGDGGGIRYHDRVAIRAQLFCVFRFWFWVKFCCCCIVNDWIKVPSLIASLDLLHRFDQAFHQLQKSKWSVSSWFAPDPGVSVHHWQAWGSWSDSENDPKNEQWRVCEYFIATNSLLFDPAVKC